MCISTVISLVSLIATLPLLWMLMRLGQYSWKEKETAVQEEEGQEQLAEEEEKLEDRRRRRRRRRRSIARGGCDERRGSRDEVRDWNREMVTQ